jgi:ketosteroid isomerase-like protein
MSDSPLDVVQANSAAFSRRDADGMLELFAPDAVVLDRRPVGFGEFRGQAAVRSYYQGLFDNLDALHEKLDVVAAEGDTVVASCHLRARLTGQPEDDEVTFDYALRVTVTAGLIASLEIHDDADGAGDPASR